MPATYYYTGGRSPFEDIHAFKQRVQQQFPGITDHGVNMAVKRALDTLKPRSKRKVVAFWGMDIMTEDLAAQWWWTYLTDHQRSRLLAHPLHGGLEIVNDDDIERRKALLTSTEYGKINRSVLISRHQGRLTKQTYIFSPRTNWEQVISDDDAAILLSYPQLRRLIVREDRFDGYRTIQSYSHIPVKERIVTRNAGDIEAAKRHFRRTNAVPGVDVPTERN